MKNNVTLNNNEIFEAGAYRTLNNQKLLMQQLVSQNIVDDYKTNGIKDVEIDLFLGNYYNENGQIAKRWANGEILEVNDVIKIVGKGGNSLFNNRNNDTIYFRITSRSMSYEGQPLLKIKAQEINGGI